MREGFGEETIRHAAKCRLIIPGVNLTRGETCVFRTPHLPINREEYDWRIADIIVAATAAPTFFPHKELPDGNQYCDGGLWAIDPGVVALAESVRIMEACDRASDLKFDMSDVHMLSIGTGEATYSLSPPGSDAGMLYWSRHLAEVISVSQVQGTQLPLRVVLGNRYRQVNFQMEDRTWTLDNTAITNRLFDLGREAGSNLFDQLKVQFFETATTPYRPYP
jgi:uncharacterized protein